MVDDGAQARAAGGSTAMAGTPSGPSWTAKEPRRLLDLGVAPLSGRAAR